MDPVRLKKEEVAAEVQGHVRLFAPCGGYAFALAHNSQAGVPPANIEAMFDAARTCRW
jgi:hypothetical protein